MSEPTLVRCEPDQAEPIYRLILGHKGSMTYPVETLSFADFKEAVFDASAYFYWCADDKVLAVLWLGNLSQQARSAEFGVIALEGAHGHGRDATKALLEHGFGSLGLHRMFCTVNADNVNCLKAIEKFGFLRQDGRVRDARFRDGKFVDLLIFSILESDPR